MMKDWCDILYDKIKDAEKPLPDNDWEWFEAKFRQRRKLLLHKTVAISTAVAAIIIVTVILSTTQKTEPPSATTPPEPTTILTEAAYHPVSPSFSTVRKTPVSKDKRLAKSIVDTTYSSDSLMVSEENHYNNESTIVSTASKGKKKTEYLVDGTLLPDSFQTSNNNRQLSLVPYVKFGGYKPISTKDIRSTEDWIHGGLSPNYNHASIYPPFFSEAHDIPFNIGFDVNLFMTKTVMISSGLELSAFRSRFLSDNSSLAQRAYYLGIPLSINMIILNNPVVNAWIGVGGKTDRLVYGRLGESPLRETTFNWSLIGNAGISYTIVPRVALYFKPELSYYLNHSQSTIITYRTNNPLMFSLSAGISLSF